MRDTINVVSLFFVAIGNFFEFPITTKMINIDTDVDK